MKPIFIGHEVILCGPFSADIRGRMHCGNLAAWLHWRQQYAQHLHYGYRSESLTDSERAFVAKYL